MFDRNNYKLDIKEQQQQTTLIFLLVIIALSIIKGIYNSSRNIDQDNFLLPLLLLSSGLFCLIYGLNALTKGNLVKRRMNEIVFSSLIFLISRFSNSDNKINISKATKLIGFIMLTLSACLIIYAIVFLFEIYHN